MDFIATAKLLLQLLPLIIQTVQTVEAALPAGTPGAAKLEMVKGVLNQASVVSTNTGIAFEALWPAIAGTITTVVNTFNSTGVFKK